VPEVCTRGYLALPPAACGFSFASSPGVFYSWGLSRSAARLRSTGYLGTNVYGLERDAKLNVQASPCWKGPGDGLRSLRPAL